MSNSKSPDPREPSLEGVIAKVLPSIDRQLAKNGIPLTRRQWRAAHIVVDHVIVSFEGEDKEDFLNSLGFGFVFRIVEAWYQHVYGDSQSRPPKDKLLGLIKIRQDLYLIAFSPLARIADDAQGHMCLKFSDSLENGEDPFDFIIHPPPIAHLDSTEKSQVSNDVRENVIRMRSLWLGLTLLDGPGDTVEELSCALLDEINRAGTYVAPFETRDLGAFLLSLRLCCELVLKISLLQRNGTFKHTHDFDKLCSRLSASDLNAFKKGVPGELWDYGVLCDSRYGRKISMSLDDIWDLHSRTTNFLISFASRLARLGKANGAIAVLRVPVWLDAVYDIDTTHFRENDGQD